MNIKDLLTLYFVVQIVYSLLFAGIEYLEEKHQMPRQIFTQILFCSFLIDISCHRIYTKHGFFEEIFRQEKAISWNRLTKGRQNMDLPKNSERIVSMERRT